MSNQEKTAPGITPDRIDLRSNVAISEWASKLDVTNDQIVGAVSKVGDRATDVEMHLKGTRSTTNAERIDEVDDSSI